MKSFSSATGITEGPQLVDTFTTLSLNRSTSNVALGKMLINEQHKYLLLKYFDNERSITITTVGPQTLSMTGALTTGAKTATLTAVWPYLTCQQLAVFSNGEQRTVSFVQGSATITWDNGITSAATTVLSALGVQSYPLPVNISKTNNTTITIGQLVYTPAPVQSVQEWTKLNALPYTSSIPAYFFEYNNSLNFWPIPSATGNVITINCKVSVADMTYTDYTTGTIAAAGMTGGSNAVVGSGTTWTSFPTGTDLSFANLFISATPPKGDGMYYPIQSVTDATHLTTSKAIINAPNISGANYIIGQYPLLSPDFHDAIVYGALRIYFSSIVKDAERYNLYNGLYTEKLELMKFYLSTKQVNVDLSVSPTQTNPNLYYQGNP